MKRLKKALPDSLPPITVQRLLLLKVLCETFQHKLQHNSSLKLSWLFECDKKDVVIAASNHWTRP